jgi:hypothetical protein
MFESPIFVVLKCRAHSFRPEATDEVDQLPHLDIFAHLVFERRHLIARAFPNAAEDFAFGGSVLVELGRCQVGSFRDDRCFGFTVRAVAFGAVGQEGDTTLLHGFLRVRDGVF